MCQAIAQVMRDCRGFRVVFDHCTVSAEFKPIDKHSDQVTDVPLGLCSDFCQLTTAIVRSIEGRREQPRAAQGWFVTKVLNCSWRLLAKVNSCALLGNLGIWFGSDHLLCIFGWAGVSPPSLQNVYGRAVGVIFSLVAAGDGLNTHPGWLLERTRLQHRDLTLKYCKTEKKSAFWVFPNKSFQVCTNCLYFFISSPKCHCPELLSQLCIVNHRIIWLELSVNHIPANLGTDAAELFFARGAPT